MIQSVMTEGRRSDRQPLESGSTDPLCMTQRKSEVFMNKQHWALLHLFGGEAEGGNELSDPTPQTSTGVIEASAPDAGGTETEGERQQRVRALMEGE